MLSNFKAFFTVFAFLGAEISTSRSENVVTSVRFPKMRLRTIHCESGKTMN